MANPGKLQKLVEGVGKNKSAKMRVLAKAGVKQSEIARFLGTSDQFVSNVLNKEKRRSEERQHAGVADHSQAKDSIKVRVGPDGRIVIPAAFREALGLRENDVLFARIEGEEVHLLTPKGAALRARAIIRQFVPEGVSLVDELIEDRRRETEREEQHG